MASNKYGFKNTTQTEKVFHKKTPIEPVTLKPFHPAQKEETFESYEELKHFLQCQNPMALTYFKKEIGSGWHVEGLGFGLQLFKVNLKSRA